MPMDDIPLSDAASEGSDPHSHAGSKTKAPKSIGAESETRGGREVPEAGETVECDIAKEAKGGTRKE